MKTKDLTGMRFGSLVALSYAGSNNGAIWECLCDCGNTIDKAAKHLQEFVSPRNQCINLSCGCLKANPGSSFDHLIGSQYGDQGQYVVLDSVNSRMFSVLCKTCEQDKELFNDGVFLIPKHKVAKGYTSCGCNKSAQRTPAQAKIILSRFATAQGFEFIDYKDPRKQSLSARIILRCPKHGDWDTFRYSNGMTGGKCPICVSNAKRIEDKVFLDRFIATGQYAEGTSFKRLKESQTWEVYCPSCDTKYITNASNLEYGFRSGCRCHTYQNQVYIALLYRAGIVECIKVGMTSDAEKRIKNLNKQPLYTAVLYKVWKFGSTMEARKAEFGCKALIASPALDKTQLSGFTETAGTELLDPMEKILVDLSKNMVQYNDVIRTVEREIGGIA